MKCYNHPERDAVSTCTKCGKGLCKECTDKYSPIMCDECWQEYEKDQEKERLRKEKLRIDQEESRIISMKTDIEFSFINLAIGFFVSWAVNRFFDGTPESRISSAYYLLVILLPFSWRTVGQIIPVAGCLTFVLKFLAACVLSPLFFLYGIFSNAKRIRESNSNKAKGIILELLYLVSIIVFVAILYLLFVHLRVN